MRAPGFALSLVANRAVGPSSLSAEESATPEAPPGPTNLAATVGVSEVTLSWSASANSTSYDVFEGTSAGSESATAIQTNITGLSTVVPGLTGGTKYFYIVRAETPNGISAASNEASATPQAPASSSGGGGGSLDCWGIVLIGLLAAGRFGKGRHAGRRLCADA